MESLYLEDETQSKNRRNGYMRKTIKSTNGSFEIETPRDRNGKFEPQIIKKNQTKLADEIDSKIISLYSLGMSYRDIKKHIADMYGLEISDGAISNITDALIPELEAWQQRPLDEIYPIIWLDAIHYKIKQDGIYVSKAIYTVLGINSDGVKELLGLYLSDTESAKYWLSVLTDLQNRGVKDILIACVDGLTGFEDAIQAVFPDTEVQLCIVHQIRNNLKQIASKDEKEFLADLKKVYQASSIATAETALNALEEKWGAKYQKVIDSWRKKWTELSACFKDPAPIRRVIYTTNAVEAVHRQFRKYTKSKGGFSSEMALMKLLFIAAKHISETWSKPVWNWKLTLNQLNIYFDGRLDAIINR
ncbi:MAG: IS256 family transposase [Campylobacter sp.]|nr:IS256 family transposase [Campylobacter sp.]